MVSQLQREVLLMLAERGGKWSKWHDWCHVDKRSTGHALSTLATRGLVTKHVGRSVTTYRITPAGSLMHPSICYTATYMGHWQGEAWITHHSYGGQVHRTMDDALRWIMGRNDLAAHDSQRAE